MPGLTWDCMLTLSISGQFSLGKDRQFALTSVHIWSEEAMALQPAESNTANRKQLPWGAITGMRQPQLEGLT